jgi:hypothetical protein
MDQAVDKTRTWVRVLDKLTKILAAYGLALICALVSAGLSASGDRELSGLGALAGIGAVLLCLVTTLVVLGIRFQAVGPDGKPAE